MDIYEIVDKFGHTAAPVEAADRDRMQACARHMLAAITAVRDATNSVTLANAVADFSAGIQPLLEAVFDCGDMFVPSFWQVEEHLVRYVAGKEDDLPDFTTLERVLVGLRDNEDGLETEEEREQRRASGVLTQDEHDWAQECAATERYLNAKFAYEASLDDWRNDYV